MVLKQCDISIVSLENQAQHLLCFRRRKLTTLNEEAKSMWNTTPEEPTEQRKKVVGDEDHWGVEQ